MDVLKKILLGLGGLCLLVLGPTILGVIIVWAIGVVVCTCIVLLILEILQVIVPNIKLKNISSSPLSMLLGFIMSDSKSKFDIVLFVVMGIVGVIVLYFDIWLLGESYFWIPIAVGGILYFILKNINDNDECKKQDD